MIPLAAARAQVLAACPVLVARSVPIADAVGCVTTGPVVAQHPVPSFSNSAMDGFAVQAADVAEATEEQPVRLRVIETVNAGATASRVVESGRCIRIMTGAPIPPGADAVVLVERSRPVGEDEVDLTLAVDPGTSVRPAGGDVQAGDEVIAAATLLKPAHIGVLATLGLTEVMVVPRPRVGVISTGDELIPPGRPLGPGQIHDSNRPMLLALVSETGALPVDLGHVPDDESALEAALRAASTSCDVIVSSGGVSMGDADVVKLVLGRIADMSWMQIAIRPAKPFALGVLGGTPIIGLPGNPVSSLVSFELLARPGIRSRAGRTDLDRPVIRAVAGEAMVRRRDGKTHFVRVVTQPAPDGPRVVAVSAQGSHQLSASASADGLAVLPDGEGLAVGSPVDVVLLG